jgi:hypothetical protein
VNRLKRRAVTSVWPALAGLLAALEPAAAQQETLRDRRTTAVECCVQLLVPVGARATALANTLIAQGGPDAVFVNPAGLAALERDELRIHNAEAEVESSNAFGLAFRIGGAGVLGLTYRLSDWGESQATDPSGNPTGTLRHLYHYLVAGFGTSLGPDLSAGVSYRVFQWRNDCSGYCMEAGFAATTHGVDFGAQYHPAAWPALRLGASLTHLGPALQVLNAEQADPMPTRVRVGAAYELAHHFTSDTTMALWATAGLAGSLRDGVGRRASLGLELILDRTIYVRAGYGADQAAQAAGAVGVGLRYDRFDIGIARSFMDASSTIAPFQITFAVGF